MDRVAKWSGGTYATCGLYKSMNEDRNHLFFKCAYSSYVWDKLDKGIMRGGFTLDWNVIIRFISDNSHDLQTKFCIRYTFQTTLYLLWRRRNSRKHGDAQITKQTMVKICDKTIRNRLSTLVAKQENKYEGILRFWFASR